MPTDYQGVTQLREWRIPRPLEAPKGWVSAGILAAVVAGVVSNVAASTSTAPASSVPTAGQARVIAVDVVRPQVVDLVFAKPAAPAKPVVTERRTTRSRVRTQPTTTRMARAATPVASSDCTGAGWEQRRGAKAVSSLLHPVPAGVTVAFLPGRGALKGMTYYDRHHVDVYVNTCAAESAQLLRHVVAHEMGHAWDSLHMTADLRAAYLQARGIAAGTPWFGCSECQDFATPAGDFAETYAQWQRGATDSRSQLAGPATAAELAELGARFFS